MPAVASSVCKCSGTGGDGPLRTLLAIAALLVPVMAPATVISNTVNVTSSINDGSASAYVFAADVRTSSSFSLLHYAPSNPASVDTVVGASEFWNGSTYVPMPALTDIGGNSIAVPGSVALVAGNGNLKRGEPMFLRLRDADQNNDPFVAETVILRLTANSGTDVEQIRVTETGVNTGEFIGSIKISPGAPASYNGVMNVGVNQPVRVDYADADDAADSNSTRILVDPYGVVFDSATGNPVNGATIRLVDVTTGLDAVVYGDDGVSTFPATLTSGGSVVDSGGTTYNFPAGNYRFPFLMPGNYRLQVTAPSGYGAPSTVSTSALQALPGAPFEIVTGSRGEAFTVNPGPALEIDIPLDPVASGGLFVSKRAPRSVVAEGDFLQYQVDVNNTGGSALPGVTVTDRLPTGFRYQAGSSRLNGSVLSDPAISADGRTLTFSLGSVAATTKVNLSYVTVVTANAKTGFATNRAQAQSGSTGSNTATATVRVTEDLLRHSSQILGRVSQQGCGPGGGSGVGGVRLYLEDGRFVESDDQGLFHFDGVRSGAHVVQLDTDSLANEFEVIPCRRNTRTGGHPRSQFVDVRAGGIARVDFQLRRIGSPETGQPGTESALTEHDEGLAGIPDRTRLAQRYQTLVVVLRDGLRPRLLVDGQQVSDQRIGFRARNHRTGRVHYSYIGVDTGGIGHHVLEVEGIGPFGNVRFQKRREVIRTGEVAGIRVLNTEGNIADGRTPVRIKLKLLDPAGEEIAGRVNLELRDGNLRRPTQPDDRIGKTPPVNQVSVDGEGYIRFAPVSSSGSYHARLAINDVVVDVHTYVKPYFRDWIMVGIAEGTLAHRQLTGNMQNLADAGLADEFYRDGRLAFYAKGVVKGEWLVTTAFDSARQKDPATTGLANGVDPDRYYTLYGDASEQGLGAASADKLYLKLERDRFYALYGDYDTGMTVTELSRYSRRLTGLKTEYQGKDTALDLFASDGGQAHARDEIRGRGVSGLYRLSNRNIVINSDRVSIEVRDRYRSHVVLSERLLTRHADYNIDPIEGTLYFKQPVAERDPGFNPVYIVVDYETADHRARSVGGRAVHRSPDGQQTVGTTMINEYTASGTATLTGIDARTRVSERTEVVTEFAHTYGAGSDGSAIKAEVIHRNRRFDTTGYYRRQDANFGLGQVRGSEAGTVRLGLGGRYRHDDKRSTLVEITHDEVTATGASRDLVDGRMEFREDGLVWNAGLRQVSESSGAGSQIASSLLTGGIQKQVMNRKVDLRASSEIALQRDTITDYPNRLLLGADYRVRDGVQLFAEQEFTYSEQQRSTMTRSGVRAIPWNGAVLHSSLQEHRFGEGDRVMANIGLAQTINLRPGLDMDFNIDRAATLGSSGAPFNVNVPPVSGTIDDDYTAVGSGVTYRQKRWSGTARVEFREGGQEDKLSVIGGLYRQVTPGMGLSASLKYFDSQTVAGDRRNSTDLRLGFAYRPADSRWMILNRLDLIESRDKTGSESRHSNKMVNNLAAHLQIDRRNQLEMQFGYKTVVDNFDGLSYPGNLLLLGGEYRFDITSKWDLGIQMTTLQSIHGGNSVSSRGISSGWSFAPKMWASVGYNFDGFTDNDFAAAGYTARGMYVKFRFAMDQDNARRLLAFWE